MSAFLHEYGYVMLTIIIVALSIAVLLICFKSYKGVEVRFVSRMTGVSTEDILRAQRILDSEP